MQVAIDRVAITYSGAGVDVIGEAHSSAKVRKLMPLREHVD